MFSDARRKFLQQAATAGTGVLRERAGERFRGGSNCISQFSRCSARAGKSDATGSGSNSSSARICRWWERQWNSLRELIAASDTNDVLGHGCGDLSGLQTRGLSCSGMP
jgi:hypothetical protein